MYYVSHIESPTFTRPKPKHVDAHSHILNAQVNSGTKYRSGHLHFYLDVQCQIYEPKRIHVYTVPASLFGLFCFLE